MRDVIDFYGRTPDELRTELEAAIEDYLAWCAEESVAPEEPGSAGSPPGITPAGR